MGTEGQILQYVVGPWELLLFLCDTVFTYRTLRKNSNRYMENDEKCQELRIRKVTIP